jgi:hypothetical protein
MTFFKKSLVGGWGQKVIPRPSADSFAVGRGKNPFNFSEFQNNWVKSVSHLTSIDHEEYFIVPSLGPHLLKRVRQLHVGDLFRVLKLKENTKLWNRDNIQSKSFPRVSRTNLKYCTPTFRLLEPHQDLESLPRQARRGGREAPEDHVLRRSSTSAT